MRAKLIWIEMIERRLLYSSVIPRSEATRNLLSSRVPGASFLARLLPRNEDFEFLLLDAVPPSPSIIPPCP
jgi:hypothetical protein